MQPVPQAPPAPPPPAAISCDAPRDSSPSIDVWHIVISGFTEHRGDPTGSQKLWLRLRQFARPRTAVEYFPWCTDWSQVAEWIARCAPDERPPRVYVYAYSWGGGWGFPNLAAQLRKRSIEIETAVLADAVYRPRLRCLAWLALCPWSLIEVPDNVRAVWPYIQKQNWPRGHRLIADAPGCTLIYPPVECLATHTYMDDSPAWQRWCLHIADNAQQAPRYPSLTDREGSGHGFGEEHARAFLNSNPVPKNPEP